MTQSISLNTGQLSQAGFVQLISSSLDSLEQKQVVSTDPMVTTLLGRLKTKLPLLQASLKQKRGSPLTQSISKTQRERNGDIAALVSALKSYRQSRLPDKLAAYQELLPLAIHYKEMTRVNMEDSMALVTSFLTKLAKEPHLTAVKTLGLTEFVANLKDSQEKLYQLYLNRSQEVADKPSLKSAAIRQSITKDYKLLYKHLQTKLTINPEDPDKVILLLLNDIRKDHADNVKRRKPKPGLTHKEKIETTA